MNKGTLFVVATPIGNRDDLAPRAQRVLREVDLIAAEDTRHTGRLLSNFGIETPQMALHEHNEERVAESLIQRLLAGESVALVSDAGTPLISDPGYRLLVQAHAHEIVVSPVPGPSAMTSALSVAGLATDRFCFEGFLPSKSEARRAALERLSSETRSLVFLVSVHRIQVTVDDLVAAFGRDRLAFIGREISKLHEQCVRAPLAELAARLRDGRITSKGEFVVVVAGAEPAATLGDEMLRRWLAELTAVLPGRQAADIVARVSGRRRNDVYRVMLALKGEGDTQGH